MPKQKHYVETRDARGLIIGDDNPVYQHFLDHRYTPLAHKLIAFTTLIEEKTKDFIGRQFVFEAFDEFVRQSPSGYFIIKGEAGIGKSALMAHLVKTYGYVHHFVVSTQGINRAEQFLENVCAQLIARFEIDRPVLLPPEASRDSAFLSTLLEDVSRVRGDKPPIVVLVDALDEVDWPFGAQTNVLYLPTILPKRVFFVVTMRHKEGIPLQVEQSRVFYLDANSPNNQADVLTYITAFAQRDAIQQRLAEWHTSTGEFAQTMLAKSEGNFMYLCYVLPAIARSEFVHGTLNELPQGLKNYYERHWRQMRAIAEDNWVKYRQPVISFLAAAREPVTVWQVADWSKIEPARVLAAIRDWREFLDEETGGPQKRYRIYHASFQDFLADKDEAKEINLRQIHSDIADELLRQWAAMKVATAAPASPPTARPQIDHMRGLQHLQVLIEQQAPALQQEFLALEARLLESLNAEALYGSTEVSRSERLQAVASLNDLTSRAKLASSYNDLCRGGVPDGRA